MKKILVKVDRLLQHYFGLEKTEIIPQVLKKNDHQLMVLHTESFKRHTNSVPINKINFTMMDSANKEKLGIAVGKMIADDLVVSFDEIIIKRDRTNAR